MLLFIVGSMPVPVRRFNTVKYLARLPAFEQTPDVFARRNVRFESHFVYRLALMKPANIVQCSNFCLNL